jgi:hypothetical protein
MSLLCTSLKTHFNSYASFLVSFNEEGFPSHNNRGVWSDGCLIAPFYEKLNSVHICFTEKGLLLTQTAALSSDNLANGDASWLLLINGF